MRCLVTGGAGFIGSHLCERLLNDGHEVWALDNLSVGRASNIDHIIMHPRFAFFKTDLNRAAGLDFYVRGVDWVFHLAARADVVPSIQEPVEYYKANVTGTMRLLEACRRENVKKFVYAASSSCYGDSPQTPTVASAPINCKYPYALTKYLGEQLCLHWGKVYGLPVVSLRLFNVYGPRARTSGTYGAVFGVFLAQLYHGKPLTVVGDGTQSRDFTYVTDVVDAFVRAADSPVTDTVLNIGTGKPQSVNRLVELLGATVVEHIPRRPGEPDITCADPRPAASYLLWHPKVSFEEGVAIMKKQIPAFKDAPLWDGDKIDEATKDWFKFVK